MVQHHGGLNGRREIVVAANYEVQYTTYAALQQGSHTKNLRYPAQYFFRIDLQGVAGPFLCR